MNDPERLLLGEADEHERALLRAATSEEPSAAALTRLRQTLGLPVEPTLPAGVRPPAQGSHAPAAVHAGSLMASKWFWLAAAGVAVVGALALTRAATTPRAAPAPSSLPGARPDRAQADGAPSTAPTSELPEAAAAADTAGASALVSPALRDELARLERARTELHEHSARARGASASLDRARAALDTLDDYDRHHPRGTLREEALALRVEALSALHERTRAAEQARLFLRDYPHSVHGARVRAQLEQHGAR